MKIKLYGILILLISQVFTAVVCGQEKTVYSPDCNLAVTLLINGGKPLYTVTYKNKVMLEKSPLGLKTNEGDLSTGVSYVNSKTDVVSKEYEQEKIKKSKIKYQANVLIYTVENSEKQQLSIRFQVSDNDIAFRYELPE